MSQIANYFRVTQITSEPCSMPQVQRIIKRVIFAINKNKYIKGEKGFSLKNFRNQKIKILDPFARNHRQKGCITVSNDLDPQFNTTYNLEAHEFAKLDLGNDFDLILFDPPYSLRQLKDCYNGIGKELELWQTHNMWGKCKDDLVSKLKIGGYVISFGWNTQGFGKNRGFEKREINNFQSAGAEDRYNLLVTVEQKTQRNLDEWIPL